MANPIVQRLIAAGATPQRAQQFATAFAAKLPPTAKTRDIQDAFDAEIAAFSAAQYPNAFRPPTINDDALIAATGSSRIDDYIKGAYDEGILDNIREKSFQFKAPDLYKILQANPNIANMPDANLPLDALIVKKIYIEQIPIGQLKNELASGTYSVMDPKTKINKPITGALLPSEYGALVDKYAGQDAAQLEEETKLKGDFLLSDKYYKVGLPTPKLAYGLKENLAEGVIDFKTHPSIERIISSPEYLNAQEAFKPRTIAPADRLEANPILREQTAQGFAARKAGAKYKDENLLGLLLQEKANPFFDEVKRREYLKDKSTFKP